MSKNARNFGDPKSAFRLKWAGAALMLAVTALSGYVPHSIPFLLIPIVLSIAMRQYAIMKQGEKIQKYAEEGYYKNPLPSIIFTTVVSLVTLLLGFALFGTKFSLK